MVTEILCQILYCKGQKFKEPGKIKYKVTRTLQHHEIIFVYDASGHIMIGGNRYPIKKGILFYIPPGVQQTIELHTKNPKHYITVHFSSSRMVLDSDRKWKCQESIKTLHQPSAQEIKDYIPVKELFEKLVDSWNDKGPSYEFVAGTLLRQLFILVFQNNRIQSKNYAISK